MIRPFVRANALRLVLATLLAALNAGAGFATFAMIDKIATRAASPTTLIEAPILLLTITGSALLIQTVSAKLGAEVVSVLRTHLAERLLTYPYIPERPNSPAGLSAFISDIGEIAPLAVLAPLFLYNSLFGVVAVAYLFYVSAPLALWVIVETLVLQSLSIILLRPIAPAFDLLRAADDDLFSGIHSLKSGRKELLTNRYRAAHYQEHVILPAIDRTNTLMRSAHSRVGHFAAWSSSIFYIIIVVTVLVSNTFVQLPKAQFVSFFVGCLLLIGPINFLISAAQQVSRGLAAVRRIQKFSSGGLWQAHPTRSGPVPDWQVLSLRDVEYVYDQVSGSGSKIGPLSFSIGRGELVFVVGGNGSGKSTLLLMLSGLLDPSKGSISIDSQCILDSKEVYRERLSGILSDFHIFDHLIDGTGNVADAAAVRGKIVELGLQDVIEVIDGKLSRTEASAGQRKRLALLQLMLEGRELLVLDEVAADLDSEFKKYFYCDLLSQFKAAGKTVILATHDAEYFSRANRVVYMADGQLVESQSQDEWVPGR